MDKSVSHVLVVDDNPDCAESLALLINMEGFSVATAGTLAEAKAAIRHRSPQLVFLDMTLPDGNGLELFQHTRDIPDLAIVMLTGSGNLHHDREARQFGAIEYLVKPAEPNRLLALLARLTC